MRVLIACPIYQVYSQTIQSILCLDWPHRLDTMLLQNEPEAMDGYARITQKYNDARRMVLDGGYDALLTIEADMIVPRHALAALAETGADVAYGLYCWRHEKLGYAWSAYSVVGGHDGQRGRSLSDDPHSARQLWGQMVEVQGLGLGCTLIRRSVLEAVAFQQRGTASCDWYFAQDVAQAGYSQAADLSVVCGHIQHDRVYWPDPDSPTLYRLDPL